MARRLTLRRDSTYNDRHNYRSVLEDQEHALLMTVLPAREEEALLTLMMMMTMRGREQEFGKMLVSLAQGRVSALRARIRKLIVNPNERVSFCQQWNHQYLQGDGQITEAKAHRCGTWTG